MLKWERSRTADKLASWFIKERRVAVLRRFALDPRREQLLKRLTFGGEERVTVMRNGNERTVGGIKLRDVSAYNQVRGPEPGSLFHPEMGDLSEADLVFVPINLPYTMPPEAAVSCIKVISPGVVMPYDQGESDPQVVADALAGSGIEVRVLNLP